MHSVLHSYFILPALYPTLKNVGNTVKKIRIFPFSLLLFAYFKFIFFIFKKLHKSIAIPFTLVIHLVGFSVKCSDKI